MNNFNRYFLQLFGMPKVMKNVRVRRMKSEGKPEEKQYPDADERHARIKIVHLTSWILALVLIISFAVLAFSYLSGKPQPDFFTNAFFMCLGYFGGAFAIFMGNKPKNS